MNYQTAREYIENIQVKFGSNYSLREVAELDRRMGRPERDIPIIHIAGTNGKGSVGAFLSHILAASGYTVGRYVSPAILSYRERIQRVLPSDPPVTEYISRGDVAEICGRLQRISDEMRMEGYSQPTAFELETVMAFEMFRIWGVDVALVECGMGGRSDATNIIEQPIMCIFTSISMDHMAMLGESLQQISGEKYGIVKKGTSVVSLRAQPCEEMLCNICKRQKAGLYLTQETESIQVSFSDGQAFCYRGREYHMSQAGLYQQENASLALEAAARLAALGFGRVTEEAMEQGIRISRWRGRFEVVSQQPFILVDGAHNADGAKKLYASLKAAFPEEKFHLVAGVFKDKEYDKIMEIMLPLAERVFTVTAPGGRGLSAVCLKEVAEKFCAVPVLDCGTVEQALTLSCEGQAKTVVFGSLSILGRVYSWLEECRK